MTTAEVKDHDHQIERRDLDELLKLRLKDNPKKHDDELIKLSIDRFGFVNPVLVGTVGRGDKDPGLLGAGHGRLKDLDRRKRAREKVPRGIRVVDGKWMVPTIVGVHFRSRSEYREYVVMDNRATEKGGWEAGLYEYLKPMGKDLVWTGFSQDDVRLLASARNPWVSDIGALDGHGSHVEAIPGKVIITCKPKQTAPIKAMVVAVLARKGFKGAEVT